MPPVVFLIFGFAILAILFVKPKALGRKPPCGSYGDIDGDGWVTQKDAELLGKFYWKTVESGHPADLNGDGVVNIADFALMAAYLEGKIDTFPVCER